jgi:hypothetical protein
VQVPEDLANEVDTQAADRAVVERRLGVGGRQLQRIERDAVVAQFADGVVAVDFHNDVNVGQELPLAAVGENICDEFIKCEPELKLGLLAGPVRLQEGLDLIQCSRHRRVTVIKREF